MFQPGAVVLSFLYLIISAPEAFAKTCPNQPMVHVISGDDQSVAMICEASDRALSLLAQYEMSPKRQIYIEVINQGIDHLRYKAFGSYDIRED